MSVVVGSLSMGLASVAGDHGQPQRQRPYLRALRTIPRLTITLGHFPSNDVRLPAGSPTCTIGATVLVRKTEEKGPGVNLATLLLKEGFQGLHYVAVVISNDSDLVLAVQVVRAELAKPVGVLDPHRPEFPFAAERELLHSERCGTRG